MSANENSQTFDREELVALLERLNLSVESFDALRPDSYEQSLALHSLEHLELLYSELLKPGQKLEEAREHCPPWPPATPRAGKLPGISTIADISERLRTEQTLNSLGRVSGFLDKLRNRALSLPVGQQTEVLDSLVTLVGEELLEAKLGGTAVSANLDPLDRLLVREDQKRKAKEGELKEQQWKESMRTKLQAGLDELASSLKGNAEAMKLYQQIRQMISRETK